MATEQSINKVNNIVTLTADSAPKLAIAAADIKGMALSADGDLVVTLNDGNSLTLTDFELLAQKGTTITLADGSSLQTREIFEKLAGDAPAQVIATPAAGAVESYDLLPGRKYSFSFEQTGTEKVEQIDGALVITFDNGGQIVLKGFEMAATGDVPPELTFNGEFLSVQEFAMALRLATLIDEGMEREEGTIIARPTEDVMQGGAEEMQLAAIAEQLASIEPAAGDTGGNTASAAGASAGGFGFQSAVTPVDLGTIDMQGPIGRVQYEWTQPEYEDRLIMIDEDAPPAPPPAPTVNAENARVYEDGSVTLNLSGQSNATGNVTTVVTVTGIPSGWTVVPNHGGTYDPATGTVTYIVPPGGTPVSGGPTLSPPADSDADIPVLNVTVTNTDNNTGLTSTTTTTITVTTDAVADDPDLDAADDIGPEGSDLDVVISTAVTDVDGSETITSVVIKGVPDGFDLSAGTRDPVTGDWVLDVTDLPGLTMTPPANFVGTLNLVVESTATETNKSGDDFDLTNDSATVREDFTLTWLPNPPTVDIGFPPNVPQDPNDPHSPPAGNAGTFDANNAWVKEDGSVDVVIEANLRTGHGPNEVLTVTVTGIDPAWGFSAPVGTYDSATGTWSVMLAPGQNLSTVMTFTPPAQTDIDLSGLTATASAYVPATDTTSTDTRDFGIVVDAVADAPAITVDNNQGNENTAIRVVLNGALGDDAADGSEIITGYAIGNVPDGFAFVNAAGQPVGTQNGTTWNFTVAEAADLYMTAPADHYGPVNLTATVFNTENPVSDREFDDTDNNNQATTDFTVTWQPLVEPPSISVNGGIDDVVVKEDNSVDVTIVANRGAGASPTEYLTVTVTGIDPDWGFSAPVGTYDRDAGTWTVVLEPGQDLDSVMTFTPPADSDLDLSGLTATVVAREPATGSEASADDGFNIIVDAVADAPELDVDPATVEEGRAVPLVIETAATDTDGSEIVESVTISGLPPGATLNAGTYDAATNTWTLTPDQLAGLTVTVPDGVTGVFNLTVTSTVFDQNVATTGDNREYDTTDNRASTTQTLVLTVTPDDVPQIVNPDARTVDETALAGGDLTTGGVLDVDFGADGAGARFELTGLTGSTANGETVALTSGGVPVAVDLVDGAYIGTANGQTIFTITLDPVTGEFLYTQQGTLDHPLAGDSAAAHDDVITLQFGFTAHDNDGDSADGTITVNVRDDGPRAQNDVNSYNTADGGAGGNVITGENGGAGAADSLSQDGATNVTQVRFGGTVVDVPATGTVTIEGAHGVLTIAADGTYSYVLNAGAPAGGVVETHPHDFGDANDFPALSNGQRVSDDILNSRGVEPGSLTVAHTGTGTVSFVSEGAGFSNSLGMYTVAADGTIQDASMLIRNGNRVGVDADRQFTAEAGDTLGFFLIADGATANNGYAGIDFTTGGLSFVHGYGTDAARPATVHDNGADITLVYTDANGVATVLNGAVYHTTERGGATNLNADGSVRVVSGTPEGGDGTTLRIGFEDRPRLGDHDFEDMVFDITFTGTSVTPQECPEDVFTYVITDGDGDTSEATLTLDGVCPPVDVTVKIPNITDLPNALNPGQVVEGVLVKEDGSVFIELEAGYTGGNGNETMTITVTGIEPGWALTGTGWVDQGNGTYTRTLAPGDRSYDGGFTVRPPANSDADLSQIRVTATVTGPDAGDNASAQEDVTVVTDAVIDTPELTVADAVVNDGEWVDLVIGTRTGEAVQGGTDGSETITYLTIEGLPDGATLNHGTNNGGIWTLSVADLNGLRIFVPEGQQGTYMIRVTSHAAETNLSGVEVDLSDNRTSVEEILTLRVNDNDQPVAQDDTVSFVSSPDNATVTGTVIANDTLSADNPNSISHVTVGGRTVEVVEGGTVVDGTYGRLTIHPDGSYSYTLYDPANNGDRVDQFGYTLRDGDGDSSNATLTITSVTPVDVTVKIPNITEIENALDPSQKVQGVVVKEDGTQEIAVQASYTGGNGNETMTVTVTGFLPGWTVEGGGWTDAGNGTFTRTLEPGQRSFDGSITVRPPENSDGDMPNINVTATVTGPDAHDNGSASENVAVITDAVIDTPTLHVSHANVNDGNSVKLDIVPRTGEANQGGTDGSEAITHVTVHVGNNNGDFPAGSYFTNGAGVRVGTYDAATKIWTFTAQEVADLYIFVPEGSQGIYDFKVTAYASEQNLSGFEVDLSDNDASVQGHIRLTVNDDDRPVAKDDSVTFEPTKGQATITGNIMDNDTLSADNPNTISHITVGGRTVEVVTGGTTVNTPHGQLTVHPDGRYSYTVNDPANAGGKVENFTYTLRDVDGDSSNANLKIEMTGSPLDVTVKIPNITEIKNALDPSQKVQGVVVKEDGSVFVKVQAGYTGGDGDETMTVTVTGIEPGWTLEGTGWQAQGGGTYVRTLPVGERVYDGGFTVRPPKNSDADLSNVRVTANVTGPDANDSGSAQAGLVVVTDAVIDTPYLDVGHHKTVNDGNKVKLDIVARTGEERQGGTDGSEVITKVTIYVWNNNGDFPKGSYFVNSANEKVGTYDAQAKTWTFTGAESGDLYLYAPEGSQGTYDFKVKAYASEQNLSGFEVNLYDNDAVTDQRHLQIVIKDDEKGKPQPKMAMAAGDDDGFALYGAAGNDIPLGDHGDQVLYGQGGDVLTGGAGADMFGYLTVSESVGRITDFNVAEGDRLDLSGLLDNSQATDTQQAINDFVFSRVVGNDTVIAVDLQDGKGAQDLVVLEGIRTSVEDLNASGSVII